MYPTDKKETIVKIGTWGCCLRFDSEEQKKTCVEGGWGVIKTWFSIMKLNLNMKMKNKDFLVLHVFSVSLAILPLS